MSSRSDDEEGPSRKKSKIVAIEELESPEKKQHEKIEEEDEVEEEEVEEKEPEDTEMSPEEAVEQFVVITATDEALAKSILQDVSWDLKRALDVFYGSEAFKQARKVAVMGASSSGAGPMSTSNLKGFELSVMSWNIDGLDGRSLLTRMRAVAKIVKTVNPDILFLQEVVDRDLGPIDKLQSLYNIYYSNKGCQYYTAILVTKMLDVEKHDVIHYQNSGMFRTLQILEGNIGGMKIFLLNTHLESMKDHRGQRCAQFGFCMDKCRELIQRHPDCLLFFGGDLNLRDDEVSGIPEGMKDAWVAAGSDSKTKYTWDTRLNDNKQGFFNAKLRFDRLYYYAPFNRVQFSLEGRQRIRSCLCFPSDHWAINSVFTSV